MATSFLPTFPFGNHTWRLSHHTGVATPLLLHALLFAASTFQDSRDPATDITSYIASNELLPPNIREDSGQPEVWRDYQQMLSELGLIFSTRSQRRIQLTTIGLAFLDGSIAFSDLMTIQAFKMQYPNGHHTQRSPGDPSSLNFAQQQVSHGILIKPAVLLWQALVELARRGSAAILSVTEIEALVMPTRTNTELPSAINAILRARSAGIAHFPRRDKQRRNARDWINLLSQTAAFSQSSPGVLELSEFSKQSLDTVSEKMLHLIEPRAFYRYSSQNPKESWYLWYGGLDANSYPIPEEDNPTDYPYGPEPNERSDTSEAREIRLATFQSDDVTMPRQEAHRATISSVYSAALSNDAHRLHDSMVKLIAKKCSEKNAQIFVDPATVDLLVVYGGHEFLIEVKSANSKTMTEKIRKAIGQIMHYDFLRSRQTMVSRRKVIALTLDIPQEHWTREFINGFLEMDLLTLSSGALNVSSNFPNSLSLFN